MDNQQQWNAMLQDMFCRIYNTQYRHSFYETGVHSEQNRGEFNRNTSITNSSASRRLSRPVSTVTAPPDSSDSNESLVSGHISSESASNGSYNGPKAIDSGSKPTMTSPDSNNQTEMMVSNLSSTESDSHSKSKVMESGPTPKVALSERVVSDHLSTTETKTSESDLASTMTAPPDAFNKTEPVISVRLSTASTPYDSSNEHTTAESSPASTVPFTPDTANKTESLISDRVSKESISHDSLNEPKSFESEGVACAKDTQPDSSDKTKTLISDQVFKECTPHDSSNGPKPLESGPTTAVASPCVSSCKTHALTLNLSTENSQHDLSHETNMLGSSSTPTENVQFDSTAENKTSSSNANMPSAVLFKEGNRETNTTDNLPESDDMSTTRNGDGKILLSDGEHKDLDTSVQSVTVDTLGIVSCHGNASSIKQHKSAADAMNGSEMPESQMKEASQNESEVSEDTSTNDKPSVDFVNVGKGTNSSNGDNLTNNDSAKDTISKSNEIPIAPPGNISYTEAKPTDTQVVQDDNSVAGLTDEAKSSDMVTTENNNNNRFDSLMKDETSGSVSNEDNAVGLCKNETLSVTSGNEEIGDKHEVTTHKIDIVMAKKSDGLLENEIVFPLKSNDIPKDDILNSSDQSSTQGNATDALIDQINVENSVNKERISTIASAENKVDNMITQPDVVDGDSSDDPCNHGIIANEITVTNDDQNDVLSYACKMADIPISEDEMQEASCDRAKPPYIVPNDMVIVCPAEIDRENLKTINKSYRCCYCLKEFRRNRTGFLLFRKHKKTHERRYYKSWHKICKKKSEQVSSRHQETLKGDPNVRGEGQRKAQEIRNANQNTQASHEAPKLPRKTIVREENSILFRLLQKPNEQPKQTTPSDLVSQTPVVHHKKYRKRRTATRSNIPVPANPVNQLDPYQQAHQAHLNQTSWYGQPHGMPPNQAPVNPYIPYGPPHSAGVNPMTSWAAAQTAASALVNTFDSSHPMAAGPGNSWPLSHIVAYNLFANSYPHLPMPMSPGNPGVPPYPPTVNSVNPNETSHPNINQMNSSEQPHPPVVNPASDPDQATGMNSGYNHAMTMDIGASYLQHLLSINHVNRDNSFAPPIPMDVNQHASTDGTNLNRANPSLQTTVNPVITSASDNLTMNPVQQNNPSTSTMSTQNANYVDCGNVIVNLDDPDASLHAAAVYSAFEGALPQNTVANPVTSSVTSYSSVTPGLPSDPSYSTTMNSLLHATQPDTIATTSMNPIPISVNSVNTTASDSIVFPGLLPHSGKEHPVMTTTVDSVIQNFIANPAPFEAVNTTTVHSAIPSVHPEFTSAPHPNTAAKRKKTRRIPILRKQSTTNPANPGSFDPSHQYVCYSCQINLPDDSSWRTHMLSHSVCKNHTKRGRPRNSPNTSNNNNYVNL